MGEGLEVLVLQLEGTSDEVRIPSLHAPVALDRWRCCTSLGCAGSAVQSGGDAFVDSMSIARNRFTLHRFPVGLPLGTRAKRMGARQLKLIQYQKSKGKSETYRRVRLRFK